MDIERSGVKRILVITLSNVGDIILTTPVVRALAREFQGSRIDVMVGPRGKDIFEKDPHVFKLIIYDKHISIAQKRRLQLKLKKLRYDLVVDLRNTIFPLLIGPRYRTSAIQRHPPSVVHSKDRHLHRLLSLGVDVGSVRSYVHVTDEDARSADELLRSRGVVEPFVVVNAGAKSHLKRWTVEGFAEVADRLREQCKVSLVFIGQAEDEPVVAQVTAKMKHQPHVLVGLTNIRQLAHVLKRARLLVTNDSAPLHLGCAVGVQVLAIFGPTDPKRYGPTGEFDASIFRKLFCSPCEKAECEHDYECMKLITPDEVFEAARMMIEGYE